MSNRFAAVKKQLTKAFKEVSVIPVSKIKTAEDGAGPYLAVQTKRELTPNEELLLKDKVLGVRVKYEAPAPKPKKAKKSEG
jgi:hypothetical protein